MEQMILQQYHCSTEFFQCICNGADIVHDCACKFYYLFFQFPKQPVVFPDLSVDLTAVRGKATFLHITGMVAFMNRWLFQAPLIGKTAVIHSCVNLVSIKCLVDCICPCFPPFSELRFTVHCSEMGFCLPKRVLLGCLSARRYPSFCAAEVVI